MNTITNINITSGEYTFPYLIEYIKGDSYNSFKYFRSSSDGVLFETELIRHLNIWDIMVKDDWVNISGKQSYIRIYFPEHSVESFKEYVNYALDIYTYIGTSKVVLGSARLNRHNALAAPHIKYHQNIGYYEYMDISILDPYDIIYNDDFEDFRKSIKEDDINNDCSLLYCDLHVIEENNGSWIPDSDFNGGINIIQISDDVNDFLNYKLSWNGVDLCGSIEFNKIYKSNIREYLYETYSIDSEYLNITYMLTVNGVVEWTEIESPGSSIIFNKSIIRDFLNIQSWNDWRDGMSFMSTAIISVSEDEKLILKSNPIPITQELFSKLLISDTYKIDTSKYFDEDMNINIINSIQQPTTSYNIPENPKSNVIIPVFYKVHDLGSIVIHPEVNENICINLDAYKSRVDAFILQVEGVKFNEIGTTNSGTIFKIIGPSLPTERTDGTYYILSQDGELVTTGKYIYEL